MNRRWAFRDGWGHEIVLLNRIDMGFGFDLSEYEKLSPLLALAAVKDHLWGLDGGIGMRSSCLNLLDAHSCMDASRLSDSSILEMLFREIESPMGRVVVLRRLKSEHLPRGPVSGRGDGVDEMSLPSPLDSLRGLWSESGTGEKAKPFNSEKSGVTGTKDGAPAPSGPEPEAHNEEPHVVSIHLLENGKEVGSATQIVNLSRNARWVDGKQVTSFDRLGRMPPIRVKFDRPGSHAFTLKVTPRGSNAKYTATELARNGRYNFTKEQKYTTDGNGTRVVDRLELSCAGGDVFEVEAIDALGKKAGPVTVTISRMVFYVELKMPGVPAAESLKVLESEFAKHHVKLVSVGSVPMQHMPNIANTDSSTFMGHARSAYSGSSGPSKAPHVIAVAYTDHLAVKGDALEIVRANVAVGPDESPLNVKLKDDAGNERILWNEIVPGESWFMSGEFVPEGDSAREKVLMLRADMFEGIPIDKSNPKMMTAVRVDVTKLPKGRGTITFSILPVGSMRAGLSYPGNIICVCTKAWWRPLTEQQQNQVAVHEIGHQLGMVPEGKAGLDRVPTQYIGKGHVGSHCHKGLEMLTIYTKSEGSECVMFGQTNGRTAFCAECGMSVVKQDLSNGFKSF
jgi:hypothetical protein